MKKFLSIVLLVILAGVLSWGSLHIPAGGPHPSGPRPGCLPGDPPPC